MILCSEGCIPCCDFCIHVIHDRVIFCGTAVSIDPIGCSLHPDEEHQRIAEGCGYCEDYHCFRAKEE